MTDSGHTVSMRSSARRELEWQAVMFRHFDLTPERRAQVAFVRDEFTKLADFIVGELPAGPEAITAMRQLMAAKDSAVRAVVRDTIPHSRGGGPLDPTLSATERLIQASSADDDAYLRYLETPDG